MAGLKIGQVAALAGVNRETVRYYERRGLMPEPPGRPSGYREYPEESVARIQFIKGAQALGFSLTEIEKLLALRVDSGTSCDEVRRQAQKKLEEIDEKIRGLQQLQSALTELVTACDRGGPEGECPIIEALEYQSRQFMESNNDDI